MNKGSNKRLRSGVRMESPWRFRWMIFFLGFCVLMVFVLAIWWKHLLYMQSMQIAELQTRLGTPLLAIQSSLEKTHRMLSAESTAFFVMLAITLITLFAFHWRDYRRSRQIQLFFASVTHELRTPLTSIRLQAEEIADAFQDLFQEPKFKSLFGRLLEDSNRLESQVEKTLELARIEGGATLKTRPLELVAWLHSFLEQFQRSYPDKIEIDWQPNTTSVLAQADPFALQLVFRNLLENAIRHSGKATVKIQLHLQTEEKLIRISLRDNGAGFKGAQQRLGELFYKGDQSRGSGLGLYLVRKLIQRMGGTVFFPGGEGFPIAILLRKGVHGE